MYPDWLYVVQETALDFAENLILLSHRSFFLPTEVKASIDVLTVDKAASVCACTMDRGPRKASTALLRELNRRLLKQFI